MATSDPETSWLVSAPMTGRRAAAVAVGIALTLAACGGGDSESKVSSRDQADATTTTSASGADSSEGAAYVGLTKAAAIAKAEADGHPWRITREDDENFPATLDYNPDRVSFEIDNGRVTQASFG